MKVIVLKVKGEPNLAELAEVIRQGHTLEPGDDVGGWQILKDARPGDLAIWYAAAPDQDYRAWGWVCGIPARPASELMKHYGPVTAVRAIPPVGRKEAGAKSGFNEHGVGQLAEEVKDRVEDFLLALGFPPAFVAARDLISAEVATVLCAGCAARHAPESGR